MCSLYSNFVVTHKEESLLSLKKNPAFWVMPPQMFSTTWGSNFDQITPWVRLYMHANFQVSRYNSLASH